MAIEGAGLPLEGMTVLDLSRLLPGPWASMLLGDYGAEVVKVEQPGRGDYSRHATPRYERESVYFSNVNRNKRSLTLNLRTDEGREILLRLAERADVVLESFRPGIADRLGIGYEAVRERNGRAIYCSVTGFGQTGPYRGHAGHDLNIAGLGGFLQVDPEEPPRMSGFLMADFAGAAMCAIGVLLALQQRGRTGRGQYLDVAMLDSLVGWASIIATSPFARLAGASGEPRLQVFGANPRYNIYRCADGRSLSVSLLERAFWEKLCRAVGRADMINEDETEEDRLTDHGELREPYRRFLVELFAGRDRDAWVAELQARDVPCCPIHTPDEVWQDPQVAEREMLRWVEHDRGGRIPQIGFPIKSSEMAPRIASPPPLLGEHTDAILEELGYRLEGIVGLRERGVV